MKRTTGHTEDCEGPFGDCICGGLRGLVGKSVKFQMDKNAIESYGVLESVASDGFMVVRNPLSGLSRYYNFRHMRWIELEDETK